MNEDTFLNKIDMLSCVNCGAVLGQKGMIVWDIYYVQQKNRVLRVI